MVEGISSGNGNNAHLKYFSSWILSSTPTPTMLQEKQFIFISIQCQNNLSTTFVGHRSVSMRASLTAERPPTSVQPSSPAVCNVTPLNAAGVKPSRAFSKSDVIRKVPNSVDAKTKTREKQ